MKAITIVDGAHAPAFRVSDVAPPTRHAGQVTIEVRAASVNRADLAVAALPGGAQAAGAAPVVLGLDACGVVVEADAESTIPLGARVAAMVAGGMAERVCVDSRMVLPLPDEWTFEQGAAAILALMTSHNALRTVGRLSEGEAVLINAANSGVGQMAIKVAKVLGAGVIVAGVREVRDPVFLEGLGAEFVVETTGAFGERVLEATGGRGADVIVDHVGGPYLTEHMKAIALRGRMVGVGRLGGVEGTLDMGVLALKRAEIVGVTFRTRGPDERAAVAQAMVADLSGSLDDLAPRIHEVMQWERVREAHRTLRTNRHLGKIVLTVGSESARYS